MVSDIHFDLHDVPTWRAFRKWHARNRPHRTIIAGDAVDLGMMSKYMPSVEDPLHAVGQIQCFVGEANALAAEAGSVEFLEGNHDERWDRYIHGVNPAALKDAKGLSLHDQCLAHGLDSRVVWNREGKGTQGIRIGKFMVRHGHQQSGRFGGGEHLAASRVKKNNGQSEVFGHHHRAQLFCQTAFGHTTVCISNPCMTGYHQYSGDANWQRGFTIFEKYGDVDVTPYVVLIEKGRFAWGGRVYDGTTP